MNINNIIRLDLIFSYWIFIWFILYILKLIKFNPKFAIIIAVLEYYLTSFVLYYLGSPLNKLVKYILINSAIKVVPLYFVWNTKMNMPTDAYITFGLFLVYLVWLQLNSTNIIKIYNDLIQSYIDSKERKGKKSIISYYYDTIF